MARCGLAFILCSALVCAAAGLRCSVFDSVPASDVMDGPGDAADAEPCGGYVRSVIVTAQ